MKKILGLDLGTASVGWAVVNQAENDNEKSEIIKIGTRVVQYDNFVSTDSGKSSLNPEADFKGGKGISPNAGRTLKRSMRRNLQRYKLRRANLVAVLTEHGFITDSSILSEDGSRTTFQTYKLRCDAAAKEVSLEELARVLLMINKKRGYKSSRKVKSEADGQAVDAMDVALKLYQQNETPAEFGLELLESGKKYIPDFYRSDLQREFDIIWNTQQTAYPEILTPDFREKVAGKSKTETGKLFLARYKIDTADNKDRNTRLLQSYQWRVAAQTTVLPKPEMAAAICDLNGIMTNSSGYLGDISDRSKELYFRKQTVGQFLMQQLEKDPNFSLKNQVFYRQDYLDEFEKIWETQAAFHHELTPELKSEIRDIVIFYQRKLKSQKGLINFCEFENRQIEVDVGGKKRLKIVGLRVCPKSSPLFQEFRMWQVLNNLFVIDKKIAQKRPLELSEKQTLFQELNFVGKMTKGDALKLLFKNNAKDFDLNFSEIEGNRTNATLFKAYRTMVEQSGHDVEQYDKLSVQKRVKFIDDLFKMLGVDTDILYFDSELEGQELENQPMYRLWHLLYSFEGDDSKSGNDKLIEKLMGLYHFDRQQAVVLANVTFEADYGGLSSKAIRKILPFMKDGSEYSVACGYAGYRHSKSSLTKDELDNKVLKDKLELLRKNSLRNPLVEKMLNQMVHVVNATIDTYGKPDEIHVELARELKKNAEQREQMTRDINHSTTEYANYKQKLHQDFGLKYVSRNDIIRYRLYEELKDNGYKTLYSDTYIPKEKLFSRDFDVEHIIPQAKLFDDSFSNKTLECRSINIEKSNVTAYDYVLNKWGESGANRYEARIKFLDKKGSKTKYKKLMMREADIPSDFINRDLSDSQYIAKKAKEMLETLVRDVVSTTGSVTDRLRDDWQLTDVMRELNWEKYDKQGLTEILENRDGEKIYRIKNWTKRNDHRHHAMDALTVAFTKLNHVNYLNNLNARSDKTSVISGIEQKELRRDDNGKLKFVSPIMPLGAFREEAKRHLEQTLVSVKAKNKVMTSNVNTISISGGTTKKIQLTPRGQLHNESIYAQRQQYVTKTESVGSAFDADKIAVVCKQSYRDALLKRLAEFDNDPKKAFTGKNSLEKNPIYLDSMHTQCVPKAVQTVALDNVYTIRKEISPALVLEKVMDVGIRRLLENRLAEYGGDAKKAFSNLDENPIWFNKDKGIAVKRVAIRGISNAVALHDKRGKDGKILLDEAGEGSSVDFVSTGSNHHIAVYRDAQGKLKESVVTFFEATERVRQGLTVIDRHYKESEGWQFMFTMKRNEYFVFPRYQDKLDEQGEKQQFMTFDPASIDLMDPANYALISPNLFRVQKLTSGDYWFRHHLETTVDNPSELRNITYKPLSVLVSDIVKVRVNHIGQIVYVGEY